MTLQIKPHHHYFDVLKSEGREWHFANPKKTLKNALEEAFPGEEVKTSNMTGIDSGTYTLAYCIGDKGWKSLDFIKEELSEVVFGQEPRVIEVQI